MGDPVEIRPAVKEPTNAERFVVTSDHITTSKSGCNHEKCPWKRGDKSIFESPSYVVGKFIEVARMTLKVYFEFDGCDIKDAYVGVASGSSAVWGSSYFVWATAADSANTCASGCPECCERSALVTFRVKVEFSSLWGLNGGVLYFDVSVCGNGTVVPLPV